MKHLSSLLLIIFMISLPSCKFFKEKGLFNKKAKTLAILKAQQDDIRKSDSIRKVQDHLAAIEVAKQDSIRQAQEKELALSSKYNIIVGSFITPEYAKAWEGEYRKLGYEPKIINMEGGRFELVSAESYDNLRKALSRLRQFQDTVAIDAWIYIKK